MRDSTHEVCVEIEFSEIKDGIQKTKNEKNKTTIQNLVGENDTVRIKRSSLDQKARKVLIQKIIHGRRKTHLVQMARWTIFS